jgi:hypothetical protein
MMKHRIIWRHKNSYNVADDELRSRQAKSYKSTMFSMEENIENARTARKIDAQVKGI